ncbi:unnamed protein product [Brassica oleracea]
MSLVFSIIVTGKSAPITASKRSLNKRKSVRIYVPLNLDLVPKTRVRLSLACLQGKRDFGGLFKKLTQNIGEAGQGRNLRRATARLPVTVWNGCNNGTMRMVGLARILRGQKYQWRA